MKLSPSASLTLIHFKLPNISNEVVSFWLVHFCNKANIYNRVAKGATENNKFPSLPPPLMMLWSIRYTPVQSEELVAGVLQWFVHMGRAQVRDQ